MKKCAKCQKVKHTIEYHADINKKDKLRTVCKICTLEKCKDYGRTKKGLITKIYSGQRRRSKLRGYKMPTYTKSDLKDWLFAQSLFHHLYHLWEVSNFDKMLVPSVDRINDYLPYTFSNIQLMTWRENNKKGYIDRSNGKNNKANKTVFQYTKDDFFIEEYISISEASRQTKVNIGNISECCKGKRKTAGGFMWRSEDD